MLDGTLDDTAAYMAKWWCTEQQGKVTDECLQLFGGYWLHDGVPDHAPVCRRARAAHLRRRQRDHEGTDRAQAHGMTPAIDFDSGTEDPMQQSEGVSWGVADDIGRIL
ncbi:acyl-CoA dehydrogenase family protein [Cupriavidus basilensis]